MIIDSSIALALYMGDPKIEKTIPLFQSNDILQSDILDPEFLNALAHEQKLGMATKARCIDAMEEWANMSVPSIPTYWMVTEALKWAMKFELSVVNMIPAIAAQATKDILVILDEALVQRLKRTKFSKHIQFIS